MMLRQFVLLLSVTGFLYVTTALPSSSNIAYEHHDLHKDQESLKTVASTVLAAEFTSTLRPDNDEEWTRSWLNDDELMEELFGTDEDSSVEIDEENIMKPQCWLCKKIVSEVQKHITVRTKDAIKKDLFHVCTKMKKLEKKCNKFVNEHGDKIAALIVSSTKPKNICSIIDLCSSKSRKQHSEISSVEIRKANQLKKDIAENQLCVFCDLIMKKIADKLKDKEIVEEIKHEVKNICKMMPQNLANSCDQFIEIYGDLIISLVQSVQPQQICHYLVVCSENLLDEGKTSENEGVPCVMCTNVVQALEGILKSNSTVQEIEHIVENVCLMMPQSLAGNCKMFIERFGSLVVKYAQTIPPKEICQTILICSQKSLVTGVI